MTEPFVLASFVERPDLAERRDEIADPWPEFIHHTTHVSAGWWRLAEHWPDCQLVLHDAGEDRIAGKAQSFPIVWDGSVERLPEGLDDAFVAAGEAHDAGLAPSALCAMIAVVDAGYRGRGLANRLLRGLVGVAARRGLSALVAPVRPTEKDRYPLQPMERYAAWRRPDGSAFDPWIRTHERLGATILRPAPRSMRIEGSVAEWEAWTGLAFPDSGHYVVPGATGLVEIDRERDRGLHFDENVWMLHGVDRSS